MRTNIYKVAVLFFIVQSTLIAVLLNNNYMKRYFYLQSFNFDSDIIEMILGIIIFILNLIAVIVVRKLYLSGLEAERLKAMALKYNHLVEQNQIFRHHHHDIKNHLSVVSGLLEHQKYTELKEYLESYLHSLNEDLLKVETGLDEIDVLIAAKMQEAKRKGIQINLKITTNLKCGHKNVLHLVTIFGNVLDNALEAVEGLELPQGVIKVSLRKDPLDYIFEVVNPLSSQFSISSQDLFSEGFSTKGTDRGQGLTIVRRLINKLEGNVLIDTSDKLFKIQIEIPRYKLEES